jgi:hypothetical protein
MRTALVLVCLVARIAAAGPTGLNVIPTADLVPWRQASVVVQNGNTAVIGNGGLGSRPALTPSAQFGLPWNMEGGIDVAPSKGLSEYRPELNLKWTFLPEGYRWPAAAAGVQNLGWGFSPSYYLVASRTLNYEQIQYQKFRAHHRNIKLRGIRAHLGIMRVPNAWRAIVGTDIEVSDHFVFYSDWTSGGHNPLSFGGTIILNRENSVTVAALKFNDEDRVGGVLAMFTHTFAW